MNSEYSKNMPKKVYSRKINKLRLIAIKLDKKTVNYFQVIEKESIR